uniref:Cadherin domain-containing protein n=1 Tax=Callorhinchus milii TaxID=7868 RepID=A0A4W3KA03_CALMI
MQVVCFIAVSCIGDLISGQIRYSIPEELKHGAFVGNIADDLGLDINKLSARRLRIVSGATKQYLEVNLGNGILFVNEKIDRELLCGEGVTCFLHLEVVIENPLELYRIEVEILDVNDNSPVFLRKELDLEIIESASPGTRFPLESAQDPDVGTNSVRTYRLSPNEHFILDVETRSDRSKFAELVLENRLDREQQRSHHLILTAIDGGIPVKSGTVLVSIVVLDANDNVPVFEQSVYKVSLLENTPKGTLVLKLSASDLDEGSNSEIVYSFSSHTPPSVHRLFSVDPNTGEIRVKGIVDYEEATVYEIYVQAKDKGGSYAIPVHCKVLVEIIDANDNAPEVILTSLSSPVQEDATPGTVIALISVTDQDSGKNGQINCRITQNLPFRLQTSFKNYYTLVTADLLDRERVSEYNITITATDLGIPSLSTQKSIALKVSDVNDNVPTFTKPSYTVYIMENNAPGAAVCSVSALDPDLNQNSYLSYSILDKSIQGLSSRTYVSINSDNGNIYALRSFDYEQLKGFQIEIQAQDAGFPPLSGKAHVNVIILDQNDNAPVILSPQPNNGSAALEMVPRSVDPGHLLTKVNAADADSGKNARLSYQLLQATDSTLFNVALYTGEVRTTRRFGDKEAPKQTLLILVKDNGQPPLSASVTIIFSIVDSITEPVPDDVSDLSPKAEHKSDLTFYLIIILGSISFIFLLAIIIVAATKCHQCRNNVHDYSCPLGHCRDQNDNIPVIVSPPSSQQFPAEESMPWASDPGYLVTKVTATDADSGGNAQLTYRLLHPTDTSLFTVAPQTGEIWSIRNFGNKDSLQQKLVVLVRDNGKPPLSSTVTINVAVLNGGTEHLSDTTVLGNSDLWTTNLRLYLIISFGTISLIFLVVIIILAIKVHRGRNGTGDYRSSFGTASINLQMPPNYPEVYESEAFAQTLRHSVCPTSDLPMNDLMFLKLYGSAAPMINVKTGTCMTGDTGKASNSAMKFSQN